MSPQIVVKDIPLGVNAIHLDQIFRVFEPSGMHITKKG